VKSPYENRKTTHLRQRRGAYKSLERQIDIKLPKNIISLKTTKLLLLKKKNAGLLVHLPISGTNRAKWPLFEKFRKQSGTADNQGRGKVYFSQIEKKARTGTGSLSFEAIKRECEKRKNSGNGEKNMGIRDVWKERRLKEAGIICNNALRRAGNGTEGTGKKRPRMNFKSTDGNVGKGGKCSMTFEGGGVGGGGGGWGWGGGGGGVWFCVWLGGPAHRERAQEEKLVAEVKLNDQWVMHPRVRGKKRGKSGDPATKMRSRIFVVKKENLTKAILETSKDLEAGGR